MSDHKYLHCSYRDCLEPVVETVDLTVLSDMREYHLPLCAEHLELMKSRDVRYGSGDYIQ